MKSEGGFKPPFIRLTAGALAIWAVTLQELNHRRAPYFQSGASPQRRSLVHINPRQKQRHETYKAPSTAVQKRFKNFGAPDKNLLLQTDGWFL